MFTIINTCILGGFIIFNDEADLLIKIGQNVQRLRKEEEISQEALAAQCGINRSYLSEIENGKRNTTILNLHRIAVALDINLEILIR